MNLNAQPTKGKFRVSIQIAICRTNSTESSKKIESGKYGGFFASGKPVILFEGHIFWM